MCHEWLILGVTENYKIIQQERKQMSKSTKSELDTLFHYDVHFLKAKETYAFRKDDIKKGINHTPMKQHSRSSVITPHKLIPTIYS